MRHARRMQSGDDDYEYEEEMAKRRDRRSQKSLAATGSSRSRDNFDSSHPPGWYHQQQQNSAAAQSGQHHSWSSPHGDDDDDDDHHRHGPVVDHRAAERQFERSSYERSTYGPPYEKREQQHTSLPPYDRKDYGGSKGNYDRWKYYRGDYSSSRSTAGYDGGYENEDTNKPIKYYEEFEMTRAKARRDFEDMYEPGGGGGGFGRGSAGGGHKSSKDYFYDREKRSFDRESNESFDSAAGGCRRRKSYGSGDMYGSLDSREEFRDRYGVPPEKNRSLRSKSMKQHVQQQLSNEDYEQDSDGEMVVVVGPPPQRRVIPGDSRSLQRPSTQSMRPRKSSGSSPWDGEGKFSFIYSSTIYAKVTTLTCVYNVCMYMYVDCRNYVDE